MLDRDNEAGWPMQFGDAKNTRHVSGPSFESAPEASDVAWEYPPDPDATIDSSWPVVADGTLFVGSQLDDQALHAVDARTGDRRWRKPFDAEEVVAGLVHRDLVLARVVGGPDGDAVHALDTDDGSVRWTVEGATRAESAHGDQVYVEISADDGTSRLAAVGVKSGEQQWTVPYLPQTPAITDDGVFLVTPGLEIRALDPGSGEEDWLREVGTVAVLSTDGTRLYSYTDSRPAGLVMSSLDLSDGITAWETTFDADARPLPPVVTPDRLVVHSSDRLWGLEPATGEQVWEREVELMWTDEKIPRVSLVGRPIAAGDLLLHSPGGSTHVGPEVGGRLQAIDLGDGTRLWETDGDVLPLGGTGYSFAVAHDTLYFGQSGRIRAIRPSE